MPTADDTVDAILAVVDAADPPLRLLLSSAAYDAAQAVYAKKLQTWADWEAVSRAAE
jgi:hypothetical protein